MADVVAFPGDMPDERFDDPVVEAIVAIMGKIGIIGKDGFNAFQKYKFTQYADIAEKLAPLMSAHGLMTVQTEIKRELIDNGSTLAITYGTHVLHVSGNVLSTINNQGDVVPLVVEKTGLAAVRNSKGGFDDKAANKCATAALKYLLIDLFKIVTKDVVDADNEPDKPAVGPARGAQAVAVLWDGLAKNQPVIAPELPPPPMDPKTGETSPHHILYHDDPIAWGTLFIAAIKSAHSDTDVDVWINLNDVTLKTIEAGAPGVYKRIVARLPGYATPTASPVPTALHDKLVLCKTQKALNQVWRADIAGKFDDVALEAVTVEFQGHEKRVAVIN